MKTQVARWGNSTAVRLPKAIVEQLGLQTGQVLEISTSDGAIALQPVTPVAGGRVYRLSDLVAEMRTHSANEPGMEWPDTLAEWPVYEWPKQTP
ncbi:MAG: AbrB/MazE/SpoVT family DNA-binding domain-containing protein [Bosea sp. (in: a-proteobacteria)]